ncbi:uncharacterized protein LOC144695696 [Cetorhinus maximus]
MEEGGLTDTEVRSGTAGARYSDADTASLGIGGELPEEDQIKGAQESDSSDAQRDGEEEQTAPSPYLEILTEPTNRTGNISPIMWVGDELADQVSQNETSPMPTSSELDTSADSGLARESEDGGAQEDNEVTDQSASTDTHAEVGYPSCPTDRSEEESGAMPHGDCNTEAVRQLNLDLLPLDTSDVNNTIESLTPDFCDREVFFDLVWEIQSRRLNDQRCSFRKKIKDRRACRSMPSSPVEKERTFFPSMSSLQTEEFFNLIAYSQSRRLDDQRADFEDSPTVELSSPFPEGTVEYLAPVGRTVSPTQRGESPATTPTEGNKSAAEEAEIPREEEIPAEDEQDPVEREEFPAEGNQIPAEREDNPAEKEELPVESEKIPAEGEGNPAEGVEIPAEREKLPAEGDEVPAEREELPAEKGEAAAKEETNPAAKKEPDDDLYNTILIHQSATARIEDQRSHPPAYSSQAFFDLLQRLQEQRMDEQRAPLPPGLAPKRVPNRLQEERRGSIFSPLLKGMSQRRANPS